MDNRKYLARCTRCKKDLLMFWTNDIDFTKTTIRCPDCDDSEGGDKR